MTRFGSMLCALSVIVFANLSLAAPSHSVPIPVIESTLSDAQKASLVAALAVRPRLSYGEVIKQALAAGMPCEEVVAFLCTNAGNAPKDVKKIVYAAIVEGKCDAGLVITRALQAGAPLQSVVEAAIRAGVGQQQIAAAAAAAGYTPEQIATAFTNAFTGGGKGGWGGWGGKGSPPQQASPFAP